MSNNSTLPKISSFAAPTEEDMAVFEALTDDEKRQLIESKIAEGFKGKGLKLKPQDIVDAVNARRRNGRV